MLTDELDFDLPSHLIAQAPVQQRAGSRLLHYRRDEKCLSHRIFSDLPSLLRAGDLLVFNNARVIPARFMLQKSSGGKVDGLFLGEERAGYWRVLLKNLGPLRDGLRLHFTLEPSLSVRVDQKGEAGEYLIALSSEEPAMAVLGRVGRMPLPPYIKRGKDSDERDESDRERYQTVYARAPGSIAAPTAGLHFTEAILAELEQRDIERAFVTLHVGLGTFKPVTSDSLESHAMHTEAYSIEPAAAESLNRAKRESRRIIAIGTTSARVLESQPANEPFQATTGETSIFIYPPYVWKHLGALVTNFHLPRSTLIALVAAFTGLEEQRRIYREAIADGYRFFSYGDAMFVE